MGLANRLDALASTSQENIDVCPLGKIINDSSEEDRRAILKVLASPASTRSIWEALKAENFKLDRQTVALHRKGFCRCQEATND